MKGLGSSLSCHSLKLIRLRTSNMRREKSFCSCNNKSHSFNLAVLSMQKVVIKDLISETINVYVSYESDNSPADLSERYLHMEDYVFADCRYSFMTSD